MYVRASHLKDHFASGLCALEFVWHKLLLFMSLFLLLLFILFYYLLISLGAEVDA